MFDESERETVLFTVSREVAQVNFHNAPERIETGEGAVTRIVKTKAWPS